MKKIILIGGVALLAYGLWVRYQKGMPGGTVDAADSKLKAAGVPTDAADLVAASEGPARGAPSLSLTTGQERFDYSNLNGSGTPPSVASPDAVQSQGVKPAKMLAPDYYSDRLSSFVQY